MAITFTKCQEGQGIELMEIAIFIHSSYKMCVSRNIEGMYVQSDRLVQHNIIMVYSPILLLLIQICILVSYWVSAKKMAPERDIRVKNKHL